MNDVIRFSEMTEDNVTYEVIPFRINQEVTNDNVHLSGPDEGGSRLSRFLNSIKQTLKLRNHVDLVQFTFFPSYMLLHTSLVVDKPIVYGPSLAPSIMRPVSDMDELIREKLVNHDLARLWEMRLYGEKIVRARLWLARRIPRNSIHFVAFSEFQANNALIPRGVPEDNLTILPSGVPTDVFHPEEHSGENIGLLAYVPRDNCVAKHKGGDTLAKALRYVNDDISVTIVGARNPPDSMKHLYESVSGKVNFAGYLSRRELAKNIRAADALILPSLSEVENTMKIEALASGTPCIVTDGPGFRENVKGNSAMYFERANPNALAEAIGEFYKNQDYYQQQADANSGKYSIASTYGTLRDIYTDISS
jgi:glycosyltransferase involved in cell wall biosynthesis